MSGAPYQEIRFGFVAMKAIALTLPPLEYSYPARSLALHLRLTKQFMRSI
jgi:hypothetical protein